MLVGGKEVGMGQKVMPPEERGESYFQEIIFAEWCVTSSHCSRCLFLEFIQARYNIITASLT